MNIASVASKTFFTVDGEELCYYTAGMFAPSYNEAVDVIKRKHPTAIIGKHEVRTYKDQLRERCQTVTDETPVK